MIRNARGWNIREAALACGIGPQSWRNWEIGGRLPREYPAICARISAAADISLPWLLGLERELEGKAATA